LPARLPGLSSPSETTVPSCPRELRRPDGSPPCGGSPDGAAARSDSSLGVVQRSPLRRHELCASTLGRSSSQASSSDTRPGAATSQTRSVLAVPPDFDGFLRAMPRRSVAPCCRPWGSPRFRFSRRHISVRDRCTSDPMSPSGPGATGRDPRSPGRVLVRSGRPALAPSPGCLRRSPGPLRLEPAVVSPPPRASDSARRCPAALRRQAGVVQQDRECFPARCLPRDAPPFGVFPSPTAVPRHRGPMPSRRPAPLLRTVDLRCRSSLVLARMPPASRPCSIVESVAPRWPTPARRAALPLHLAQVLPSASPDTPLGLRRSQGVAS